MQTKMDKNQVISDMVKTEKSYNEALTLMNKAIGKKL